MDCGGWQTSFWPLGRPHGGGCWILPPPTSSPLCALPGQSSKRPPSGTTHTGPSITSGMTGHTDIVFAVAFSPDGRILTSGSGDRTVRLWGMNIDQAIQRICATTTNTSPPRSGSSTCHRTCLIAHPARDFSMPNPSNSPYRRSMAWRQSTATVVGGLLCDGSTPDPSHPSRGQFPQRRALLGVTGCAAGWWPG
jgi:WD40 repeat protein